MQTETIDPNFYKRLVGTFDIDKLELINTVCWIMNHSEKGRWELHESVVKELQRRKGLPVCDNEGQPLEKESA